MQHSEQQGEDINFGFKILIDIPNADAFLSKWLDFSIKN